nr:UNC-5 [Haemonchus contortus]
MEEVVLIEHPQSGHVIKSRPYRLSCKAVNARKIRFKCNNRWLDETRYESVLGTDPSTQLPYMQGSVEITRQEVEIGSSHLEDFACQCYASGASDSHVVRSDPAHVRIACELIYLIDAYQFDLESFNGFGSVGGFFISEK